MQLNISGRHFEITTPLREYVINKVSRIEKHWDHITNVHVVLSVEKLLHTAEATVHASGNEIFADAEAKDMYAAIDSLADKLDRQIIKHKEKVTNHRA